MNKLITDQNLWEKWKGQMPVIYNKENNKPINLHSNIYNLYTKPYLINQKACQEVSEKVLKG